LALLERRSPVEATIHHHLSQIYAKTHVADTGSGCVETNRNICES
jgi:hypothetical protein